MGQAAKRFASTTALKQTALILQRKCDCGQHTGGGECEDCKKKKSDEKSGRDPLLQRAAMRNTSPRVAPPIVQEVLRSPGQPLDSAARSFFEPRFGQDFSHVRVHTDSLAAESARAVQALAYTVGGSMVFGANQYAPSTAAGKALIAHELTHTVQQAEAAVPSALQIGPREDLFEREADSASKFVAQGRNSNFSISRSRSGSLRRVPSPQQNPSPPPRGTNPSTCMVPLCVQIGKSAPPPSDEKASRMIDQWLASTKSCIASGAAGSNASHQAEIAKHEQAELDAEAAELNKNWAARPKAAFSNSEFIKWLSDLCKRRQRQVEIEFHYNVIFENPPGGLQWDVSPSYWDPIDNALAALPDDATWSNPRLLQFHREKCHPNDVDPATGACVGQPAGGLKRSFTGGQTDTATGKITVYTEGLGSQPYTRSQKLGLSATAQTIRHEVGHVIADEIPEDERRQFFEKIVGWIEYPWAWISINPPPYPNWKTQRDLLKAELGFNDARLDAWLPTVQQNVPVVVGSRTYVRAGPSGAFLRSIPTGNLPAGVEFAYARTEQKEYLAELYALGVSTPEFLHQALPRPQIQWLKTEVFHTQDAIDEVARQAAVGEPMLSQFLERARLLFTAEQMRAALNEVLTTSSGSNRQIG